MPKEIFDVDEFLKLAEKARYCILKRRGETVKLKLRTKRYLYTLKVGSGEAEDILRRVKCPVRRID